MPKILLIVDDEPEICDLLVRTLHASFDEIHAVTKGVDAEPKGTETGNARDV
jgi:CheY-like chemotaxis protein